MTNGRGEFEIFLATAPGFEEILREEARGKGFKRVRAVPGGVTLVGGWPEVWRANLWIRGASRVLARLDTFRVTHLARLDQRARQTEWGAVLRRDVPFRVEASCAASRLYHSGAVAARVENAIRVTLGAPVAAADEAEGVTVMVRIERDVCTVSIDTSGALLHRRGYKAAVNRAPMRETLASLFLYECGFRGDEPVLDPMCGSGTFVIEAAEIAARLNPGRSRSFVFERLATFDPAAWAAMRAVKSARVSAFRSYGRDRDAGSITMSRANARRAGVGDDTEFAQAPISALVPPLDTPGLVIVNPPYGARLGDPKTLEPLYHTLGAVLRERFGGWRVGLVTAEPSLARATGLPFLPTRAPIPHGGLRVTLFRTDPLAGPAGSG